MPINCKLVTIDDVLKFFEEEIDGMGKKDGYPRNEGVPDSLRLAPTWEFCELTEDEFRNLEIPDGTDTLIQNKDKSSVDGFVKKNIEERVELLKSGTQLPPLIVRTRLSFDNPEASFYIEDGAKPRRNYSGA